MARQPILDNPATVNTSTRTGCWVDGLCLNCDHITSMDLGKFVERGYRETPVLRLPLRGTVFESQHYWVIVGP